MENSIRGAFQPGRHRRDLHRASDRVAHQIAGACVKDRRRVLDLGGPYWPMLRGSVLLMACAGLAHSMLALLIGPIFDRVLNPFSPDVPVLLFRVPILDYPVYLNHLVPAFIHNVWTMVACGIVMVFLIKGTCDYFGNYLVNYVGGST